MELWIKRRVRSALVPGGFILVVAITLVERGWVPLPQVAVNFFYHAIFLAAALLGWRFHSRRIFSSAVILWLAHYGIVAFAGGRAMLTSPARTAFEAICIFIPLNFLVLAFFPDRDAERQVLASFLLLLFLEATFIWAFARADQPALSFLSYSPVPSYHLRLPQPAFLIFIIAASLLLVQVVRFEKAIDSGLLWCLAATGVGLEAGAAKPVGTVYFAVAGLILAISIIENSYSLAYRDELTALPSRRAFHQAVDSLKPPYSIAMVDIDHFKSINDTYGHETGDQVLRLVASRLASASGGGEAFRVGGEEFTILYRGRTAEDVVDHLELLRLEIESSSFRVRRAEDRRKTARAPDRRSRSRTRKPASRRSSGVVSVTISIGVAESHAKLSLSEVIERADKSLYRAKQTGRNRIEISGAEKRGKREASPKGQARS
ncbi:MAG: GGDEF domain-containing protein [Acidobacteria bacterium]|nr:GGDEF domain-containing protein [Acidobacteriota bacterium]